MRHAAMFTAGLVLAAAVSLAVWHAVELRHAARQRAALPPARCIGDARAEGVLF